jgi:hypothetical protein
VARKKNPKHFVCREEKRTIVDLVSANLIDWSEGLPSFYTQSFTQARVQEKDRKGRNGIPGIKLRKGNNRKWPCNLRFQHLETDRKNHGDEHQRGQQSAGIEHGAATLAGPRAPVPVHAGNSPLQTASCRLQ